MRWLPAKATLRCWLIWLRRVRSKIPELIDAMEGRFTDHHAFMMQLFLQQADGLTEMIDALEVQIRETMVPFQETASAIATIPGLSDITAQVIVTEIDVDMSVFPDAAHLASWAGVCPGQKESAGRSKSSHTWGGDSYLKATLGTAALNATQQMESFLAARYRRLYLRRGAVGLWWRLSIRSSPRSGTCWPMVRCSRISAAITTGIGTSRERRSGR